MKTAKKFVTFLLALAMLVSMFQFAFAAEPGSITIKSNAKVSVSEKTFSAYKVLDAVLTNGENDEGGLVYKVPASLKSFYSEYFELDSTDLKFNQNVTSAISKLSADEMEAFARAVLAAAKTAGIVPASATAEKDASEVTISGLSVGYYVVEDTGTKNPVSALALTTAKPNAEVEIKADLPKVDKKIDGDKDNDELSNGLVDKNQAALGDDVPYVIKSQVPDMTGFTKYYFVVKDTFSKGLTFNNDIVIKIGDKTLVEGTDYEVLPTGGENESGVDIVFKNFIQYKAQKGEDIIITYSAKINSDARIGVEGNENTAKLVYSNNPNINDDNDSDTPKPGSPVGETVESKTYTYVTGIKLIKTDPSGTRLTGATFTLKGTKLINVLVKTNEFTQDESGEYWKLKNGSYTKEAPVVTGGEDDTSEHYDSVSVKYSLTVSSEVKTRSEAFEVTAQVSNDGTVSFEGLAAGDYTITEIVAPEGYNLLEAPITVQISWGAPETGSTACKWTATAGGKDAKMVDGVVEIEVVNQTGKLLPSTGGMGTKLIYAVGAVCVIAAIVFLVAKKRMSSEKN